MTSTGSSDSSQTQSYAFALSSLTSLFFMWGLISSLNDILIPRLKSAFELNYAEAMLIQFCFFFAYFVVSVPAGRLIKSVGYKIGIVIGLLVAALGCVGFYPSAASNSYPLFLSSLFVLASGITILQVAANPYVTVLGPSATASSRLTMTQAFNSLGTTIGPWLGGILILGEATGSVEAMGRGAESVQVPYLGLAGLLVLLAVIMAVLRLPEVEEGEPDAEGSGDEILPDAGSAWGYTHLGLGALGIFVYVGAEVSIGSFLVNFFSQADIAGMEEFQAAKYVSFYWGGAMVGRFIGALAMRKVEAGKALAFNAMMASLLVLLTVFSSGALAMWAIIGVGLFNSIMFPTIFSLALAGLGKHTSQGSAILCLAIVGGALVPLLQGVLADAFGIQQAFLLAVLCYFYIGYYGLKGSRASV
ncbi:MAG: glucose/galactose MFS transporter [Deltaproteobacteria bacterium]|nr:glucose/galactose MFS transporter [Deltaproteobacteria bacterium]